MNVVLTAYSISVPCTDSSELHFFVYLLEEADVGVSLKHLHTSRESVEQWSQNQEHHINGEPQVNVNLASRLSPEEGEEVDRDGERTQVSRDVMVSGSGWKEAFECDGISRSLERDSASPRQKPRSAGLPSHVCI